MEENAQFLLPELTDGLARFKLFDQNGKMLRSEAIKSQSFTFNRNELSSGIYFYTIFNEGKLIGKGKLIIQAMK